MYGQRVAVAPPATYTAGMTPAAHRSNNAPHNHYDRSDDRRALVAGQRDTRGSAELSLPCTAVTRTVVRLTERDRLAHDECRALTACHAERWP